MASSVKLLVNLLELQNMEKKLGTLRKNTANRHLNIQFSAAKGSAADELCEIAEALNEAGTALASLIGNTETVVANARMSFVEADNFAAGQFETSGE